MTTDAGKNEIIEKEEIMEGGGGGGGVEIVTYWNKCTIKTIDVAIILIISR